MLIEINRVYVGSGYTRKTIINTRYVKRIEVLEENHEHFGRAKVLFIVEDHSHERNVGFIYAIDSYDTIKSKIGKAAKTQLD